MLFSAKSNSRAKRVVTAPLLFQCGSIATVIPFFVLDKPNLRQHFRFGFEPRTALSSLISVYVLPHIPITRISKSRCYIVRVDLVSSKKTYMTFVDTYAQLHRSFRTLLYDLTINILFIIQLRSIC